MVRLRRSCVAAALTLLGVGAGVTGLAPAARAECPVMVFQFDPGAGAVTLSPQRVTVDAGGCVTLSNQTVTAARFTVGSSFHATVAAFDTTGYPATAAGTTQDVTANGAAGTARGAVVIRAASARASAAPARSPAPSHSSRAAPGHSSGPATSRQPVRTPTAAPPPSAGAAVGPTPTPPAPSLAPTPSPADPPFLSGNPPAAQSPAPGAAAGPLQPPTGRGTGLPAAVAALAIVATAGGLLRVLLAEPAAAAPVDSRDSVAASA